MDFKAAFRSFSNFNTIAQCSADLLMLYHDDGSWYCGDRKKYRETPAGKEIFAPDPRTVPE